MKCVYFALIATIVLACSTSYAQLPFSDVRARPTTSPYLNLIQNSQSNAQLGNPVYQNLVRPQVEARREFAQQQGQIEQLRRQQRSLASQAGSGNLTGPTTRGISTQIRPTGHTSRFMDYFHYYPQAR